MKSRPVLRWWPAGLLLIAAVCAEAAFSAGGTAFTKRYKTSLLAEPNPQAKITGELGFARKVRVDQVQGNWLHISDSGIAGWVFVGSLSETKPDESKGLDGAPLLASNTTATAAARPLTDAAEEYSQRRNLGSASEDLNWLLNECSKLTPGEVESFLKTNRKGEYQ